MHFMALIANIDPKRKSLFRWLGPIGLIVILFSGSLTSTGWKHFGLFTFYGLIFIAALIGYARVMNISVLQLLPFRAAG
jgi:hypothetical protein